MINKILVITTSDFPSGSASAKLLRLIGVGLVERKWRVEFLLQRGQGNSKDIINHKRFGIEKGIQYKYFGWRIRPKNTILKILDSIFSNIGVLCTMVTRKIQGNVDIIMVYNHSGILNFLPLLMSKILGIYSTAYVSDWLNRKASFPKWHQQTKWYDFLLRMRIINMWFDGLLMPSHFLYNFYIEKGVIPSKMLILPTVVELPHMNIQQDIQYQKRKKTRIGFCGKPTWTNGGELLIHIFKKVQEKNISTELLIMGDRIDDPNLLPSLKELSRELGISDNVTFTGMIPYERVSQLLLTCDILVLPRPSGTFAEAGFPTKLGEYLASEKPVVVTNVGDIPLYLKHEESAMLSNPGDIEQFAHNLLWLINNPEKAETIARNGNNWAKEVLLYNGAAEKLDVFFNSLVKTNSKIN
jgi:glycosyltransferase involved in cell wall biosynthesis